MSPQEHGMEVNVAEIQTQLAAAISERDQARQRCDQLASELLAITSPSEKKSRFLTMVPLEIRNAIYTLLLQDNVLSERASITNVLSYHLTPEILRTCRQIYEASGILYGSNKFFIDCSHPSIVRSSLANHQGWFVGAGHVTLKNKMRNISAIKRAQHLKVILNPRQCYGEIVESLTYLCEIICDTPRKSIELSIVLQGDIFGAANMEEQEDVSQHTTTKNLLLPLRILRNVASFKLQYVDKDEVFHPSGDLSLSQPHSFPNAFEASLKALVEGNQPVTYVFKMYDNLVVYAQSFELSTKFKRQMEPEFGRGRIYYPDVIHTLKDSEDSFSYDVGNDKLVDIRESKYSHDNWTIGSPFLSHPLEEALRYASIACELQGVKTFKTYRATVLEILEPQYQKIAEARKALVDFVESHKVRFGLLDAKSNNISVRWRWNTMKEVFELALLLLENYAKSFARDMPDEIRRKIQGYQQKFYRNYSILPSHRLVEHLNVLLNENCSYFDFFRYHFDDFRQTFKSEVNELDKNYLEIRKARRALFDHDTSYWGCDIDLQLESCDGMINWDINKPNIGPKTKSEWAREENRRQR